MADVQAALAYLKGRPDADPRGVGFFGISKGGGAGLLAAADDPYVRCFVTDGIFATYTTLVPYMRKWFSHLQQRLPASRGCCRSWYYGLVGLSACAASSASAAAAFRTWSRRSPGWRRGRC